MHGAGTPVSASPGKLRFSVHAYILPPGRTLAEQFRLAAQAGFEGLEVEATRDRAQAMRIADAARDAGLAIHSVHVPDYRANYLSASNPSAAIRDTIAALQVAQAWGADTVSLAPAHVSSVDTYAQCYDRSQKVIGDEILPLARELGVSLMIENIREIGFLLSPFEFARYIDEFQSPWVKALLDVGNMIYGHPEHWVGILGHRIAKLHVKDFRLTAGVAGRRVATYARIGRGDMDWAALRAALAAVGFSGWVSNAWPYSLATRACNRACRSLPHGTPLIGPAMAHVQWRLGRAGLGDGARRIRRHLEA